MVSTVFYFHPLFIRWRLPNFDSYFSDGLVQPPTSFYDLPVFSVFILRTWIWTPQTFDGKRQQWHPLHHCHAGVKVSSGLKEIRVRKDVKLLMKKGAMYESHQTLKAIIFRQALVVNWKFYFFLDLFSEIAVILVCTLCRSFGTLPWHVGMFLGSCHSAGTTSVMVRNIPNRHLAFSWCCNLIPPTGMA